MDSLECVAIIFIFLALIFLTVNMYSEYVKSINKEPIENWILVTSDCDELSAYLTGDPDSDKVKVFFQAGDATWNMAHEKYIGLGCHK